MNDKTEQTVTDVLPCPFCGSTEGFYVVKGSTFRWRVISCRNCGEGTEVRHKNNSDEPDSYIADWNAAAPYPAMLRKEIDNLRADLDRAIVNFGDAAATVCDMRAQLAEMQRELIAKEAERAGMELERNNAQRQHTMQCAINKIDSQRILELTAQLAKAQRDTERLDWIEKRTYAGANSRGQHWQIGAHGVTVSGIDFRAAIYAAKGERNA